MSFYFLDKNINLNDTNEFSSFENFETMNQTANSAANSAANSGSFGLSGSSSSTSDLSNSGSSGLSNPNINAINQSISDTNFQCSDNIMISGDSSHITPNMTINTCKTMCENDADNCVGFDFDQNTLDCSLKKNVKSISSIKNNNIMCIKRKQSTKSTCKSKKNTDPQSQVNNIFNENTNIKHHGIVDELMHQTGLNKLHNNQSGIINLGTSQHNTLAHNTHAHNNGANAILQEKHKSDTIFVDLPCFMNKINILSEYSDNMMVDLSLLTSNLKSCSYVKKAPKVNIMTETEEHKLLMPKQDSIKLVNLPATVLVTSNSANSKDNNMVLGIQQTEPFNVEINSIVDSYWVKLIVLILILYIIMNKK